VDFRGLLLRGMERRGRGGDGREGGKGKGTEWGMSGFFPEPTCQP